MDFYISIEETGKSWWELPKRRHTEDRKRFTRCFTGVGNLLKGKQLSLGKRWEKTWCYTRSS